jgi:hypothetical protein
MDWIILSRSFRDLLEQVDPPDDLAKQFRDYDSLSTLPGISPFPLDAFLP